MISKGDICIRKEDGKEYIVSNIYCEQIYLVHTENRNKRVTGIIIAEKDFDKLFTKKGENGNE